MLLQATNRLTEAESLLRRALAIDEQSYGPDHPMVAIRLNNLAALLKATNRLTEAEPLYRLALAIDEQSYGPHHPEVAIRLNNLALLLQAMNRLAEVEPLLRQGLAIARRAMVKIIQTRHIFSITWRSCCGHKTGWQRRSHSCAHALMIYEQNYGTDHSYVAMGLNNLALLLHATNRLEEAEPLMCRAVTIFLKLGKASGHAHFFLLSAINNYAQILLAMKRSYMDVVSQLNALGRPPTEVSTAIRHRTGRSDCVSKVS